ncbi:MAG: helix-turn-helix domain-containing protein [Lachnospiraceae bacterium]
MEDLEVREDKKEKTIVPIKDKLNLTIKEAVLYSNIGETTIRKLLREKGCPFLLKVGNKNLVKRREFEKYINEKHYI